MNARARHLPGALADAEGLVQRDLLRLERVEHDVGGHQLGQRAGSTGMSASSRQDLVGRDVKQQVARAAISGAAGTWAWASSANSEETASRPAADQRHSNEVIADMTDR